jgi:copper transport protein
LRQCARQAFSGAVVFATGLVAFLLAAAPAFGHAILLSSDPKDGAVIAAAPSEITLTFNEPVQPIVLRLIAPTGTQAPLTAFKIEGNRLIIVSPQAIGDGTHALSWRVISADGHPIGGSVVFAIGTPSAPRAFLADGGADRQVRAAIWLTRAALLVGLFIGIGGSLFHVSVGTETAMQPAARATIVAAIVTGAVAVPLSIGLQGLDVLLRPLPGLLDATTWRAGYFTSYGTAATIAAIALLSAYCSLHLRNRPIRIVLVGIAVIALGAMFIATGHVTTAEPRAVSRFALLVHVVCIAFWVGALAQLLILMQKETCDVGRAVKRFSRIIPLPVAALIASGAIVAVFQLDRVDALWRTDYGNVLTIKLAILLAVFGIAAVNRFVLTPALLGGSDQARRQFSGTLIAELALVLMVLAIVALWRFTPPPRSLAAAESAPAYAHIHTAKAMADVTIASGPAGASRILVVLQTGAFQPLQAREVMIVLANPAAGIEPISRPARRSADGETWRVDDLMLPAAGTWTINVEVLIGDFERLDLTGEIAIRR